jgi:phage-related protein
VPKTLILFYQEKEGNSPIFEWLLELKKRDRKGFAQCVGRIGQLESTGHELRRPAADYLRDGIYELRAKHLRVQYRILYFFHGQNVAILSHGIIKEQSAVPESEIEQAIRRKQKFVENPEAHTYQGVLQEDG